MFIGRFQRALTGGDRSASDERCPEPLLGWQRFSARGMESIELRPKLSDLFSRESFGHLSRLYAINFNETKLPCAYRPRLSATDQTTEGPDQRLANIGADVAGSGRIVRQSCSDGRPAGCRSLGGRFARRPGTTGGSPRSVKRIGRAIGRSCCAIKGCSAISPGLGHCILQCLPAGQRPCGGVTLLRAPDGATMDEIVAATGWLAHTARGAMSGALGKKLGLVVTSEKDAARGRVYRLPVA